MACGFSRPLVTASFSLWLLLKLKCSWFITSCWLQMYSKLIQLYIQTFYICIYIYIIFYIPFHYGLLQDIEYSSLCYTVGPCCLSILYNVNLLIPAPNFSLPIPFPFGNHRIQQSHSWHLPGENSNFSPGKIHASQFCSQNHASQHYSQ